MNNKELILQFFAYKHLPNELQIISREFAKLAVHLVKTLPRNPERTVALRNLLNAKDCAVRSKLYIEDTDVIDKLILDLI